MGELFLMDDILSYPFNLNRKRFFHEELTEENSVTGICSQEEFHAILIREKARADRNGHGFSLVAFELSEFEDTSNLVAQVKQRIRTTDEIGWFDHHTLGVFLYNTPAMGAWQFVNNSSGNKDDLFSTYKCNVYSYPNEWCNF